ncbi:MAG: hypothetical protein ISR96_08910 [Nitrospira sp.]|nr:hypothetical protein [bacterium]MBL7049619.1 hypothetical protein [Nitrospira sp.]
MELIINSVLYQKCEQLFDAKQLNKTSKDRILTLIRSKDTLSEKYELMTALKCDMDDDKLKDLMKQHEIDNGLYRYGVEIYSEGWNEIVKVALDTTSIITAMDNISDNLSGLE